MAIDICKQDEARRLRHSRSEALANWELAETIARHHEPTARQVAYEAHARQELARLRARRRSWAWLRRLLGQ